VPSTSNFCFEYESPTSLPGTTLTGGPALSSSILAVQVDAALNTVDSLVQSHTLSIADNTAAIQGNADDIDDLTDWTRLGSVSLTFASAVSFTQVVNFGFTFPGVPQVYGNINSGVGATARWVARPINVTTTDFTMFVFSGNAVAAAWTDIPVNWMAVYRP
jgi:hypothetical protein